MPAKKKTTPKKPAKKTDKPKTKKPSKKQIEFLEKRRDAIYQHSLIMLSMMSATRWLYSLGEDDYKNKASKKVLDSALEYLGDIQGLGSFENVYQGMLNLLNSDGYHGLHDVLLEAINMHKMLPDE